MQEAITFEHYEVQTRDDGSLHELGRGAMGITYKAYDTNLRVPVALKVINAAYLDSEVARERFVREARSAAKLRHRNVATVYHLGTESDTWFYAMEYIEGETLEALIKRQGPLHPLLALQIADQVARALNAAQRHGLVHRDIKPANLMLVREDDELMVKVIDFGLAKNNSPGSEDLAATSMGGFVGTPHFASPEQLEAKEIDVRSDLYSLGITLWYMLAGRTPFTGSMAQVMDAHLTAPPPFEQFTNLEPVLIALLQRMLAKDPAARHQSPTELRAEIEVCLGQLSDSPQAVERGVADEENFATLLDDVSSRAAESAWETGATIAARYRITESRGETNAGKIFRAFDAQLGRDVRLLRLKAELLQSPTAVEQIKRELERLARVRHPHLLGIHGFESIEGTSYLAMEWTDGFTLLEVLRARRELSAREVLPILAQAAAGTDAALKAGLKHMDFALHQIRFHFSAPFEKEALLRCPVGAWPTFAVKLNPLGITQDLSASQTWAGGETMVTKVPRAAFETKDPRVAAVLALGGVVYEMLGGTAASGSHAPGKEYTPLATLSEEGNAALKQALDPDVSYPSAGSFHRALAGIEVLESKRADSTSSSSATRRAPARTPPAPPAPSPLPPPPQKKFPVAFFGGVATVIAIGAAVWFFAQPDNTESPDKAGPTSPAIGADTPARETKIEAPPEMPEKNVREEKLRAALVVAAAVERSGDPVEVIKTLLQVASEHPESDTPRTRLNFAIEPLRKRPELYKPETFDELRPLLAEAARCDSLAAMLFLAEAERDRNPKESLAWYSTAAARGVAEAMLQAGLLLSNGIDGNQELEKAFEYFKMAAETNDVDAKVALGECYLFGKGTASNGEAGIPLLKEAAETGSLRAMNRLAEAYRNGLYGQATDPNEAFRLWSSVVAKKNPIASERRAVGEAHGNLGVLYMTGQGAKTNPGRAVELFRAGAALEDPNSMFYLGGCIFDGTGVKKNEIEGRRLIEKAEAAGSKRAKKWMQDNKPG